MKTTDVTGNPFDWLEYSANLSDNSRSYIVGEVLQLFPVNAQTTPKVSRKAWLTSGAGRSRLSLTMKLEAIAPKGCQTTCVKYPQTQNVANVEKK